MKPGDEQTMNEVKDPQEETTSEQESTLKLVQDEPEAVAPEADEAPEVAGPPPEDPNVLGVLEPRELGILMSMNQQARAIVQRIGEMEVEKARMLGQLSNLEVQNSQHLKGIGARLNIPENVQWQVTQDGKARKVS